MILVATTDPNAWMTMPTQPAVVPLQVISVGQTSGEKILSGSIDFLGTVGIWALIVWIIYKSVNAYKMGKREGKPE